MSKKAQTTGTHEAHEIMLRRWITVGQPADRLYALWRDPATLPQIMAHFADITVLNDAEAEWHVKGPLKKGYRWRTRIVDEQPGVVIARHRWRAPTCRMKACCSSAPRRANGAPN